MPIIAMPDGTHLDLGDNPSPEVVGRAKQAYNVLLAKQQVPQGPGVTSSSTSSPVSADVVSHSSTNSQTTTPGKEAQPDAGWTPTIKRIGGAIVGGAIGTAIEPGLGTVVGAGLGSSAMDVSAQHDEIKAGVRAGYNPWRTVVEGATNALFAGNPLGSRVLEAAASTGVISGISGTMMALAEGQPLPTSGQVAINVLGGAILGGAGAKFSQLNSTAIKELAGTDDVAAHMEQVLHPDTHPIGPDGIPTEIPRTTLLDQFGRPVRADAADGYTHAGVSKSAGQEGEALPVDNTPSGTRKGLVTGKLYDTSGKPVASAEAAEPTAPADLLATAAGEKPTPPVLRDFDYRQRPGIFDAKPEANPPPLHEPDEPLISQDDDMPNLRVHMQDMPGDEEPEFGQPQDVTQSVTRHIGRTKDYFRKLQEDTKVPVYEDYDNLSQANRPYQKAKRGLNSEAYQALKGTDAEERGAVYDGLFSGPDGIQGTGKAVAKLRSRVTDLYNVANKALEPYGVTAEDFFQNFVPSLDGERYDPKVFTQDKYAGLLDDVKKMGLLNPNVDDLMSNVIRIGSYNKYIQPVVDGIAAKYKGVDLPPAVEQALNYYPQVMDGTPDKVTQGIGDTITKWFGKMGWDVDGRLWATRFANAQYAGAMGLRPSSIIRGALHPMQTAGPLMGYGWLANGYKQMGTAVGRALVEESGVSAEGLLENLSLYNRGTFGRIYDKTIAGVMAPFGMAANFSRGSVYLGMRSKVLAAAEDAAGDLGQFMYKSGVNRFTTQEGNIIRDLYLSGDIKGAADRAAQMMTDNTVFNNSQFERPDVMRGSGKYLFAMGQWPMMYGKYMARMGQVGYGSTKYEIGRDLARWGVGNAALTYGLYKAGKLFSDTSNVHDALGWTFLSPTMFTGAPILQTAINGGRAGKAIMEGNWTAARGGPSAPIKTFARDGWNTFVPAGGALSLLAKSAQEPTNEAMFGRMLGFVHGRVGGGGGAQPARAAKAAQPRRR